MLAFFSRYSKTIAWFFIGLFYMEALISPIFVYASTSHQWKIIATGSHSWDNHTYIRNNEFLNVDKKDIHTNYPSISFSTVKHDRYNIPNKHFKGPGPTQPEMQAFSSVNVNNMVDLFSGDFSYNIPLMDVGGYPINIAYRSGISMDQEASWVGLGWNINPGTITRNLRGLPDDFDGVDSIKKISGIKTNKTIGVTGGVDLEITGFPISVGASLGIFNNNYKGWGLENSVNASINAGTGAGGNLSGGLSITNNSQEGLTLAPSLSISLSQNESEQRAGVTGSFSISAPYNSRTGLKGLQLSAGLRQFKTDDDNQKKVYSTSGSISSVISFASPSYTPTITLPFTSTQYSFTAKVGTVATVVHPSFYISGYVSKQQINAADTLLALPAYGYLHYQDGAVNKNSLLDFNREKEIAYREKPPVPHIAVPVYTYDAFSITGEGTGGMFRAYRGDIGFVFDHFIRTKDGSARASVDVGLGELVHAGVDLNVSRAFTQNGPWLDQNSMASIINFKKDSAAFEASYFRNPGEKSINSKTFYDAIGGDDVVTVGLYQSGASSSVIQATNYLTRYRNKQIVGQSLLNKQNTTRPERDKRSQVISYLTAKEADVAGLSKYIENYTPNKFALDCSLNMNGGLEGLGTGIPGQYYPQPNFKGVPFLKPNDIITYNWGTGPAYTGGPANNFTVRWLGRVSAPATGTYTFTTQSDDGIRLWLNDSIVINHWNDHAAAKDSVKLNLTSGQIYTLRVEYYEHKGNAVAKLYWSYPGQSSTEIIPQQYLYPPAQDTFAVSTYLEKERRYNIYRKPSHISEIDVLNNDGRRYIYGIPVYNFKQKEVTFAVSSLKGNTQTGLTGYADADNSVAGNVNGKDHYYSSEEIPAYAHSFLLTGIVSPDYVDVTGNGITDDDLGDAIRFNYSKICGFTHPYKWRAPYVKDSATYNDGLKTDNRDDKASYTYGEKELWYLHSIQSKTMIATFVVENRLDLLAIDERGNKYNDSTAKRLKEIDLYSKADFMKNGTNARPIKVVHFEYSYELCKGVNKPLIDSGKLTLKKIWFTYNGNEKGKQNPYIFNYNSKNPDYNIKSYDRWGNYKDPLQNPGSSVSNLITNAEYPYSLQDSTLAAQNAAAWSLDSIYLPSGGSLKVNYESDDYAYVQNKRAMQLFKLAGLGSAPGLTNPSNKLYTTSADNLYVYVTLPQAVTSSSDFYQKYLTGVTKLYFKMFVKMPSDQWGSGSEYVPCYADLDPVNGYGMVNSNLAWVKLSGISLAGDASGTYSPLVKAAVQFLRLNLPSKAYPGSEIGDNIDLADAVKLIFSLADNIKNAFKSFDGTARNNLWVTDIDTSRTFIRLNSPNYKKYGGGHRVKRITLYDNWNQMTGGRTATYGQEYTYTTQQQINGVITTISSGVAAYEPGIGGEENPFRQPIEYIEKISALGPVTLGYSEEPLGESFFPSANVGYCKVRTRTINYKNIKSANGYDESTFYTAYDFPVFTDRTVLDNDTKKRYKPALANFLRINARNYVTLSQGFKIELNDMHGKLRSQASYAETDPNNPVVYTENVYRTDSSKVNNGKRLSNTVMSIKPDGTIDSAALVGKDAELMVDMREQESITNGNNVNLNVDLFSIPFIPPFFVIPSFINLAQREQNQFRSVATVKIIQRYGILDSVIRIDKGSKTSAHDLLFDAETGGALLTRTQNEFNDPVFSFNYPAHWAYDGMGPAYKNIDVTLQHINISNGKIIGGLSVPDSTLFASGDEILAGGKQQTGNAVGCTIPYATFPAYMKIFALDSSAIKPGPKSIYFIDADGNPYGGNDISLKIIRSGRKNTYASIGSITTLVNPVVKNTTTHLYNLQVNDSSKVITANATEYSNFWFRNTSCKSCGVGNQNGTSCFIDTVPVITDTFKVCFINATNDSYSSCGSYIYSSYGVEYAPFIRHRIPITNSFWIDSATRLLQCNYTPVDTLDPGGNFQLSLARGFTSKQLLPIKPGGDTSTRIISKLVTLAQPPPIDTNHVGPLNRCGIWLCPQGNDTPLNKWIGLTTSITIPTSKVYSIGMAGDNRVRAFIDGMLFKEDDSTLTGGFRNAENFRIWHIYPVYLTQGKHTLLIQGFNDGFVGSFGLEIYGNLSDSLQYAHSYNDLQLIFSTKNIIGQSFPANYSCPIGYQLDSSGGKFICRSTLPSSHYANPYASGIMGNWKNQKNYSYYSSRNESDPTTVTNIRTDGRIKGFNPFWLFQNNLFKPQYDTTRWVWNSEIMQYNRKGLETENRDPLGRYNAGLYGYNLTLPTAVIQNSRERESAFEGFEDYNFVPKPCDTACTDKRHWDFSAYAANITTAQKHSGKNSLQVNASQQATVSADFSDSLQDRTHPSLRFNTSIHTCVTGIRLLDSITYSNDTLYALFSPSKGKRMLLSAWVKESQDCNTTTYQNNQIVISYKGGTFTSVTLKPTGAIIEGWEKYEGIFDIPLTATGMNVSLQATGSVTVYFDDLRIHPFNANMKSFVYNPYNLRLMAEQDENNYSTFYEYDDDGTLIRVKKETERGIQTIKENRSALIKQ